MNFPLESSFIFEDTKPIDHVHQSIIDLEVNRSKDNIEYILQNAFLSLDTNLEYNLLNGISSLIRTCFSYYPEQITSYLDDLLQTSKKKFNHIYALTYILLSFPLIPPDFNATPLFDDCIQQIFPQIQNKSANIKLYDYEIPPQFSCIFITNLLLLSNITKEILPDFSFYILTQKDFYKAKIQFLIQKVIDLNIFSYLSTEIFTKPELFSQVPIKFLYKNCKILPENFFREKFKAFQKICMKPEFLNDHNYFIEFVKKSVEYNLELDSLINCHIIKLISNKTFTYEKFPFLKEFSLMETKKIEFYESYYNYNSIHFSPPNTTVETNPQFWLNFMTVLLNSEKKRKRNDILKWLPTIRYYLESQNVNEFYDLIILNLFPLNHDVTALLVRILSSFSKRIRNKYFSNEHQKNLLTKVIEKRKVPHPQFWDLFLKDAIVDLVKEKLDTNENIDPILLYAFHYAKMKTKKTYDVQLKKLIILPQNKESLEKVIDFNTSNKSLSFLFNIPIESLSLIVAAKFFMDSNYKIEIEGLNGFTTLLFYANIIEKPKDFENMKSITDKLLTLLNEDYINSNKDSQIFIKLIELIINVSHYFDYPLLKAFFPLIINNQCNMKKSGLLKIIFRLSNKSNTEVDNFFNENGLNIISFFLENLIEINQLYQNKYLESFNFNSIKNYEVKIQIVNLIESKSNIDLNQFSYFISNVCKNFPIVSFDKIESNEKSIDDIYSLICSNFHSKPHEQSLFFIKLFEYFMKEKSIAITYYMVLLENIVNFELTIENILGNSLFNSFYKNDKDNFIEAFNRVYIYNPITNNCLKNNQIEYITTFSEGIYSIISRLLESIKGNSSNNNYQIFLVLKIIASSFPFLFTKNTEKIFEVVLSNIDGINSKENQLYQLANISLLFLQSCLYSTEILNDFLIWLFDKILSFNTNQITGFILILISFFEETTNKFKKILISYITKFNFINKIDILLNKKDNHQYYPIIIKFLFRFYSILSEVNDFDSIIIDELQKVENPYLYGSCFSITILPNKLNPEVLNHLNSVITKFDKKIDNLWIFSYLIRITFSKVDDIISEFLTKINKINQKNYIKMVRCLVHQPSFNQSININKIASSEQISNISNLINDFQDENETENIKKKLFSINFNKSIIKLLIKKPEFYNIFIKNDEFIYLILELIKEECINYYTYYPNYNFFIDFSILIDFFSFSIKSDSFANYFNKICSESLIYIILLPKYRDDQAIIEKIIQLYSNKNIVLPNCFLHLIDFVFLSNKSNSIKKIFSLFNKIDSKKMTYLSDVIRASFVNILEFIETSHEMILLFIKNVPNLVKEDSYEILEILYQKYQNNSRLNQSIVVELLCLIIPQRKESFSQTLSETIIINNNNNNNNSPKIIPETIFKTMPKYWEIFEHFFSSINHNKFDEICPIYPEFFNFKERYSYFTKKLVSKKIKGEIELYIDRSCLILSSFNNFERIEINDLYKVPKIIFLGEKGYDLGGLTKDWMTNLINELFNPKSGYFILTENMNGFQPNPNCHKLEYFKFAGKIIAYVIINKLYVNAHLSKPFIKQILHHKLKFTDLETSDGELYNSLKWIQNNDIEDVLDMKFTVDSVNELEQHEVKELIKNGKNIKVTNQNKNEYISLMYNYYLHDLYKDQLKEFCEGFDSIIDHEMIRIFTSSELDLIICGTPKIDIEDLKKHTRLNGYNKDSPTVLFFFNAISKWSQTDLALLLIFITGSSQVPAMGFVEFVNRKLPITICKSGDSIDRLPVAHTCFNIIDLPPYDSEELLNSKLILAVNECNDFGYI